MNFVNEYDSIETNYIIEENCNFHSLQDIQKYKFFKY